MGSGAELVRSRASEVSGATLLPLHGTGGLCNQTVRGEAASIRPVVVWRFCQKGSHSLVTSALQLN